MQSRTVLLLIIVGALFSGCIGGDSTGSTADTTDETKTLGPFPDELYVEMFSSGSSEDADIKLWDTGKVFRSDFIRTDKEGKLITEASMVLDGTYMYLTADGVCMKFDDEPAEGRGGLEFYKSIYSPNIASKEQYEKEFSPCSSRIPECKEITITEETYNGVDAYLLTMKIADDEVEKVQKVWVDRKTSFPIREETTHPTFGTTSTNYTKVEAMDIPDEIFNTPEDCSDFTAPETPPEKTESSISNISINQITLLLRENQEKLEEITVKNTGWVIFENAPGVIPDTPVDIISSIEPPKMTLVFDASDFETSKIPDLAFVFFNGTTHLYEPLPNQAVDTEQKVIKCNISKFGTYLVLDNLVFEEAGGMSVAELYELLEPEFSKVK